MKLAIIDSGVEYITNENIKKHIVTYEIGEDNIPYLVSEMSDKIGHGTAVCNLILDCLCPDNDTYLEILNIRIFYDDLVVDTDKLVSALRLCEHQGVDIINLSLGCYKQSVELEDVCNSLSEKGCIICAANDLSAYNVYPAVAPNVISICSTDNPGLLKDTEYVYIDDGNNKYNVLMYGGKTRLKWLNRRNVFLSGSSFACPKLVAFIINYFPEKLPSLPHVIEKLKNNAKTVLAYKPHFSSPEINERIALFPFNKEMHSIIRFNKKLNITTVLDMKGRGMIGKNIQSIISDCNIDSLVIKDINDVANYDNFDSVIIGDCSILCKLYGKRITEVIEKLCLHNKKIYSFMNNSRIGNGIIELLPIYNSNYYEQVIKPEQRYYESFISLMPVVGVYGSGTNQGKFTLQNRILAELEKRKIKVGFLSTEQQGIFLGCDNIFPYGGFGDSQIKLPPYMLNSMFEYTIKNLSLLECDVILTGGQSGITTSWSQTNMSVMQNINLLYITKPDVTLLVVNMSDKDYTISNCIKILDAFTRVKIACVAVFNTANYTSEQVLRWCENKSSKYNRLFLPINNITGICDSIIDAFHN